MRRLVLDTDVIVAGFRSDAGASRRLLFAALDRRFVMLASVPLFIEYESVLSRSEQLAAMEATLQEIGSVPDALVAIIEPVELRFLWRPKLKDPNDEMVLETAVNGGADTLVTFNSRHFEGAAAEFGVRVALPRTVWREMNREI